MNSKETLRKYGPKLLAMKNVVAVGIGEKAVAGKPIGKLALVCSVEKKVPLAELKKTDIIPKEIEGIITDVIESGKIKALKARTDRWRPAPGGVSIGHEWITAGTLGCLVKKGGFEFILSNNHVLADSNNAPIDSAILQPGKYDGGDLADRIAVLKEFVPIKFIGGDGCRVGQAFAGTGNLFAKMFGRKTRLTANAEPFENLVDCAIALPVDPKFVVDEVLEIGTILGINKNPGIGLNVQKSGRTTAITKGVISQVDVMTNVEYGEGKIALFVDQLMIEKAGFSAGGDSGSVILDTRNYLVGLLFAGSDTVTIANKITNVFDLLGVSR